MLKPFGYDCMEMKCGNAVLLLASFLPFVCSEGYQLSFFFYGYEVPQESCTDQIHLRNISLTSDANLTASSVSLTSSTCYFTFGYDENLEEMNPLAKKFNQRSTKEMGLVLIEFINKNTSDNFSIVVNLTELNSNDSFGKRHQYQAADSNFLLELNIKKDEGHPVPDKFSITAIALIVVFAVLVLVLVVVIVFMIIFFCMMMSAANTSKNSLKNKMFNRCFIDPNETIRHNPNPEEGNHTRSRLKTRLTLINGSLYLWRSIGRKGRDTASNNDEGHKNSTKVQDTEGGLQRVEENQEIMRSTENIYEDPSEKHIYEDTMDEILLASPQPSPTHKEEFSEAKMKLKTKDDASREKTEGRKPKAESDHHVQHKLQFSIKNKFKNKKQTGSKDSGQETKGATKADVTPKKKAKKEKKKSKDPVTTAKDSEVFPNPGAVIGPESKSKSPSQPVTVVVENHQNTTDETSEVNSDTKASNTSSGDGAQEQPALTMDVKNLISTIEKRTSAIELSPAATSAPSGTNENNQKAEKPDKGTTAAIEQGQAKNLESGKPKTEKKKPGKKDTKKEKENKKKEDKKSKKGMAKDDTRGKSKPDQGSERETHIRLDTIVDHDGYVATKSFAKKLESSIDDDGYVATRLPDTKDGSLTRYVDGSIMTKSNLAYAPKKFDGSKSQANAAHSKLPSSTDSSDDEDYPYDYVCDLPIKTFMRVK